MSPPRPDRPAAPNARPLAALRPFFAPYRPQILLAAIFLLLADTLARTIMAPAELPVGVVTAAVGAPFFLFILRRFSRAARAGQ